MYDIAPPRRCIESFKNKWLLPIIFFLSLFLLWEIICLLLDPIAFVLPKPSCVSQRLFEKPYRFAFHTLCTIKEMIGGVAISFSIAFPLAWLMQRYRTARTTLQPLFIIIQCMPTFALAPIMVLCFGWSYTAIVVPTSLMIFFPLTLNIYKGLSSTPRAYLDLFESNQATEWQIFKTLRFPWALPHIFSGLRISAAIAGIGAVAGEWAGAQAGLGILMQESRRCTDTETTFAAFFCLTLLSFLFYGSITLTEYLLLKGKNRPSFSRTFSSLLIVCGIFLFSGCQSPERGSSYTKLLLDWFPNPNHIPLFAGIKKGIFAKHGLNIDIQKLHDPADSIPYLTSGKTDLAIYYMPYAIKAKIQGADFKIVGVLFKEPLDALLFRKDASIKTIEDLNGKTLGYSLGGLNAAYICSMLEEKNIYPKETRNVHFDLVSSIGAKHVDAAFGACWNIETEHLKSLGIETGYFKLSELNIPDYYELMVLGNKTFLKNHPEFANRFQKALDESIIFCQNNPEEAFNLYVEENPDKFEKTLSWEKKSWHLTYPILAKNQRVDEDVWKEFCEWMRKHRLIDRSIDCKELLP